MRIDIAAVRRCLKSFDFKTLFREHLGWDNHQAHLDIPVGDNTVRLTALAQKRGFVAFTCPSIPDRPTRLKIDHQVTKSAREHFVIYCDQPAGRQVWQWVRREQGKPLASRDHRFDASQSGDPLIQRLDQIAVGLDEEEQITVVDVAGRARAAFDVDKVTKKFYDRFKAEHAAFLKFIKGIKATADLQWYTSLMLNRLMFVYFIQKKGFLDGDPDYLRNRLAMVRQVKGKDKFQSFYRYFLLRLFHDGLGKSPDERKLDKAMEKLLGKVPYLNGGFFEEHELEQRYPETEIPDKAFEKLFDFFDQYSWHLDERPLRAGNEINPDVVGYIFEKYINQKQMGAYYTKEDITEYISKNTIIPFLFDAARKKCDAAFNADSALWRLLRDDPDRYIYPAVGHSITCDYDRTNHRDHRRRTTPLPLPVEIEEGINDVLKRGEWNKPAPEAYALPTETWREVVARRQRCLDIREKLRSGEVHEINDLITLNLDIWQFARDAIINSEGPELLRAFWHAIEKLTVLDPTCGSGAFLFAALRILETLYSDCLERMERFVEDLAASPSKHHPEQYNDFKKVLELTAKHPNERYFILKSIIINNLFGVDIMAEAVEICKLRLFLKLVAQVETVSQIEPLPDIDFNIRAGNTLVGYATLDQVRKSQEGKLGFTDKLVRRIEEDAEMVKKAFQQFRAQQTTHGGKVTRKDKQELRTRLAKLDAELDRYLAGEYGINVENQKAFDDWKASHEPFHWFVEFYGIMAGGGFDVIIGNPPYVEYTKVRSQYSLQGYHSQSTNNLYAMVSERAKSLLSPHGRMGVILPNSSVSAEKLQPLQEILTASAMVCVSHFAWRPSKLFEGANMLLAIWLIHKAIPAALFTTRYHRWSAEYRPHLFPNMDYLQADGLRTSFRIPKMPCPLAVSIYSKCQRASKQASLLDGTGAGLHRLYYFRAVLYWFKVLVSPPVLKEDGKETTTGEMKTLTFPSEISRDVALAVLVSNLFALHYTVWSSCQVVNSPDIRFPVNLDHLTHSLGNELQPLARRLIKDVRANSVIQTRNYCARGREYTMEKQYFFFRRSKQIIDEIDAVLARHYGFTDEELDFVINYDIKHRMGGTDGDKRDDQ